MEYTKEDWSREGNKITAYERGTIAVCPSPKDGGVFEFIANAHLIASAPDLYEALVGLLEAYDVTLPSEECDYPDYWVKALQARAKAEGK